MNSMFTSLKTWLSAEVTNSETHTPATTSMTSSQPRKNDDEIMSKDFKSADDSESASVSHSSSKTTDHTESVPSNNEKEATFDNTCEGTTPGTASETCSKNSGTLIPNVNLKEMSERALDSTKNWGNYLYSFGKDATEQMVKTAKVFKNSVEERSIFSEFSKEQDKFVTEQQEKMKRTKAAVPVWVGINDEQAVKSQILALSTDKRNFLRNPPAGVHFDFEYCDMFPVAMVMLEEDPKLQAMRFELVPKQVKEEIFWKNYFYRVSLIKQSAQLTALVQQAGSSEKVQNTTAEQKPNSNKTVDGEHTGKETKESEDLSSGSLVDQEFVSDAFQSSDINDEELKKEMQKLHVKDKAIADEEGDIPEWEKELQAELQGYEVLDEGNSLDDDDIEKEIINDIENDTH